MAPSSRIRRLLPRLLIVALATVVGVEAGSRLLDRARGRPWKAEERRAGIEETWKILARRTFIPGGHQDPNRVGSDSSLTILSPYSGWEHLRTHPHLVAELEYYRSPEAKETFDVCVLGGSVAQLFAQIGAGRLVERLREDPRFAGREVKVHDDACAGYKQPQPAMVLAYLLARGHEPDAVIEIDGFNEAALGWNNAELEANPAYPFLPNWARATNGLDLDPKILEDLYEVRRSQTIAGAYAEWLLRSGWWRSSFLGHVGILRLEALQRRYVGAFQRYSTGLKNRPQDLSVKGPRFASDEASTARALLRAWEESSVTMQGLCAARGILYLHVLQPALPDPGTKPLTPSEILHGQAALPSWIEGVHRLYPRMRVAGVRLAERGIAFHDATGVFRDHPEDVYTDVCHFGERGNEILADSIAAALLRAAAR
jgi:hypothetical protein